MVCMECMIHCFIQKVVHVSVLFKWILYLLRLRFPGNWLNMSVLLKRTIPDQVKVWSNQLWSAESKIQKKGPDQKISPIFFSRDTAWLLHFVSIFVATVHWISLLFIWMLKEKVFLSWDLPCLNISLTSSPNSSLQNWGACTSILYWPHLTLDSCIAIFSRSVNGKGVVWAITQNNTSSSVWAHCSCLVWIQIFPTSYIC